MIGSIYIMVNSFSHNVQNCLIRVCPEFYKFRRVQNSWMRSHFVDCMLFAFIHAILTSLLLESSLMSFNTVDGKLVDYEIVEGTMSFVMGIVLISIVMAGPMDHTLIKSTCFIVFQTLISFLPSLLKVMMNSC